MPWRMLWGCIVAVVGRGRDGAETFCARPATHRSSLWQIRGALPTALWGHTSLMSTRWRFLILGSQHHHGHIQARKFGTMESNPTPFLECQLRARTQLRQGARKSLRMLLAPTLTGRVVTARAFLSLGLLCSFWTLPPRSMILRAINPSRDCFIGF